MPMREVSARLEDLFMACDECGLWDELAGLILDRLEAGEETGGLWLWETFRSLCVTKGLV